MTTFTVNGSAVRVETDPDTPLLWVIRENLGLTGTKFGCGMAQCGCCRFTSMADPFVPA